MDESQLYRQQAIGQRLRELRQQRAWTLRDLAARLGVTYQTISRWELGNMAIGEDTLRRVANFFNVRPEWLTTGEGPLEPELGSVSWPAEDLLRTWGLDVPGLPSEWPEPFKQFIATAVAFGVFPSVSSLANMVDLTKALGTDAPLPGELELAVRGRGDADSHQHPTMTRPKKLSARDLRRVAKALELIGRTLPWTPTGDRESPEHPWIDIWGGDGDLLLEVGDNLAYDVYGPDLAKALITLVTAAPLLLAEVERIRTGGAKHG